MIRIGDDIQATGKFGFNAFDTLDRAVRILIPADDQPHVAPQCPKVKTKKRDRR